MTSGKRIVMMGPDPAAQGGVAAVVNVYESFGFLRRYDIEYLVTVRGDSSVSKIVAYVQGTVRLLAMLLTGKVALAHVHMSFRGSFARKSLLLLMCRAFGVPAVLHLHSGGFPAFYERECGRLRQWLARTVFEGADRVIVLSTEAKRWVESVSRNRRVVVVFNPVQLAGAPALEGRGGSVVLFLGKVWKPKGVYDLLEATRLVVAAVPALTVRIGGRGEVDQVRSLAQAAGVADHVELAGWIGGDAKVRCLASANVFVLPSYHEGMPMGVLEAMAAEVPVVATRVGGIPDAVTDGVEGFLVEPGDVVALADRLTRLLIDRSLAERMGKAARTKVEAMFSAQVVVPQVGELYDELLGCSR